MKKSLLLLCIGWLLLACGGPFKPDWGDDDEYGPGSHPTPEPSAIVLSIEQDVNIDDIDFEFEILEGGGGYTVQISERDGKVTIDGNRVIVNLFRQYAFLTITDQAEDCAYVWIYSSNELLNVPGYTTIIDVDQTITNRLGFGVGGYTIEKIRGNSAEAMINENDQAEVKGLKGGNAYFIVTDRRGCSTDFNVWVNEYYDLVDNHLEIEGVTDQVVSVRLLWGEGNLQFYKEVSSPLIRGLSLYTKEETGRDYGILQIYTSDEELSGTVKISLIDEAGKLATVTVVI